MSGFAKKMDTAIHSWTRMNVVSRESRNGRPVWIKRRRSGSGVIIRAANLFFRLTGAHSRIVSGPVWQQWETDCFRRLYNDRSLAGRDGARAVWAGEAPGMSLCDLLKSGCLTETMLAAVGRELSRAHQVWVPQFDAGWSHGDLQMENVFYDPSTGRVRLIDFETMHEQSWPERERHADDLLVLLLDLAGQIQSGLWLSAATELVDAYGRFEVLDVLKRRLVPPTGAARVWWAFRTSYLPPPELWHRLNLLRERLP